MKSIILGAFILSLFFAVAQSISLNPYSSRHTYKKDKRNGGGNIADSSSYVLKQTAKAEDVQLAVTRLSR